MKIKWDDKCIVQYPMFLDFQGHAEITGNEKLFEAITLIIDFYKFLKKAADFFEKNDML